MALARVELCSWLPCLLSRLPVVYTSFPLEGVTQPSQIPLSFSTSTRPWMS